MLVSTRPAQLHSAWNQQRMRLKILTIGDRSSEQDHKGANITASTQLSATSCVSYDAGAELLTRFQNSWSLLHTNTEENAKQAKVTDKQIGELQLYVQRENESLCLFLQETSTLPQILRDLDKVMGQIQGLQGQFSAIESELVKLEDICEREELNRNKHHHAYQLKSYQQRRSMELERAKVQMAKIHATKVQNYEQQLQKNLLEKQQAFEATFKEEMLHYKKYGKISENFSPVHSASSNVDLSEFTPDLDHTSLDEFLHIDIDEAIDAMEESHELVDPEAQASTQDVKSLEYVEKDMETEGQVGSGGQRGNN